MSATGILARLLGRGAEERRDLPEPVLRHRGAGKRLDMKAPIEVADFVAFDTELTGLDSRKDSIVSIGAIRMRGGRILPGRTFCRLVRPESELNGASVCIHGLTHSDLCGAGGLSDALKDFLEYVGDAILLGHFVGIDLDFVGRAMRKHYGVGLESRAVDMLAVQGWLAERSTAFVRHFGAMADTAELASIARHYGVEAGKPHDALGDAYVTAQIFQRFMSFLPSAGVTTVGGLIGIGKP